MNNKQNYNFINADILKLLVFALISEVPFNLFYASSLIYPFHQNTIFTLLLGLLAIKSIDNFKNNRSLRSFIISSLVVLVTVLLGTIGFTDYGTLGVLTVIAFYLSRDLKARWLFQLISMVLLNIVFLQVCIFFIPCIC